MKRWRIEGTFGEDASRFFMEVAELYPASLETQLEAARYNLENARADAEEREKKIAALTSSLDTAEKELRKMQRAWYDASCELGEAKAKLYRKNQKKNPSP